MPVLITQDIKMSGDEKSDNPRDLLYWHYGSSPGHPGIEVCPLWIAVQGRACRGRIHGFWRRRVRGLHVPVTGWDRDRGWADFDVEVVGLMGLRRVMWGL